MPNEPESISFGGGGFLPQAPRGFRTPVSSSSITAANARSIPLRLFMTAIQLQECDHFRRHLLDRLGPGIDTKRCFHVMPAAGFVQLAKLVLVPEQGTQLCLR